MAKIVDPDALNRDTEIIFDTVAKTIQLAVAGNLDDSSPGTTSGVTLQAVYSKCKELWKSETDLNKLAFPFEAITAVKMDLVNGWSWADEQTRDLVRDGGWCERDAAGDPREEYMGIISLGGKFASTVDTAYYQQVFGFDQTTTDFDKSDELNEPVRIYDVTDGTVNYRNFFKIFLREQGKLFAGGNLLKDQNLPELDYTSYKLPLVNATDIKIEATDATIETHEPWISMTVDYLRGSSFSTWVSGSSYPVDTVTQDTLDNRWYRSTIEISESTIPPSSLDGWESYPGEFDIGGNYYAFNRIVYGADATLEKIYEFAQYQLRSTLNINDNPSGDNYGTIRGNIAVPLCSFLGDVLQTDPGVFISSIDVSDKVRIEFYDITVDGGGLDNEGVPITTTKRTYPYVAAGKMTFNDILVDDPVAEYRMYFTSVPGGTFDTTSAIIVNDADGNPIQGESIPTSEISFTFDYDNNNQGGRTPGTDAPITIVALGLTNAQWVKAVFTITRSVGLNFPVNAAKERNYSNP